MKSADALAVQVLAAIAAMHVGCKDREPPTVVAPIASVPSATPIASSPPTAVETAEPPPPPPKPVATSCSADTKKTRYCIAPFKGPASQIMNPSYTFDAKGCVPLQQVVVSCNGITAALSGPRVEANECCYTVCQGLVPPCGRPLIDDRAAPRVARTTARSDWSSTVAVRPSAIAARLRNEWLADAAAEHASVASFARFTLELLSVGAPSELVEASMRAGLDEIEHARLSYAIASAYGEPVGPGPLSLDGVAPRVGLPAIAAACAAEGAVGETIAALTAREACARCTDPAIATTLDRIATDEAEHALLAWRFLAWALANGDETVRAAVTAAFDRAVVHAEVLATVIAPARSALGIRDFHKERGRAGEVTGICSWGLAKDSQVSRPRRSAGR